MTAHMLNVHQRVLTVKWCLSQLLQCCMHPAQTAHVLNAYWTVVKGKLLRPATEMLNTPCINPFSSAYHRFYTGSTPVKPTYLRSASRVPVAPCLTPGMPQNHQGGVQRSALVTKGEAMYHHVHYVSSDSEDEYTPSSNLGMLLVGRSHTQSRGHQGGTERSTLATKGEAVDHHTNAQTPIHAESSLHRGQPRRVFYDDASDDEDEYTTTRERIPTLRPAQAHGRSSCIVLRPVLVLTIGKKRRWLLSQSSV